MSNKWRTDRWFVSPWNYEEEVTSGFNFAKEIKIHDVTLRDGEQQTGLVFNKEDKIRIAEKLAEVGVHRIEAGMPRVSKQDYDAIKEIVRRNLGPKIFAFSRCIVEDVKMALDCGVDGIVIEIPSSRHMIENAYGWPVEKAIDMSIEATSYARENNLYTVFFPVDMTRSEMDWFLGMIERVATEGHMDALGIVDTMGVISPSAVRYLVRQIRKRISKPLEAHFHNDFGCGAANTVLALAEGVEVAHTTISGIGERTGNAPFEDVVLMLLTLYGIDLGLRYEKIYETSKLVQEIAGLTLPPNREVVGDYLFKVESGIVADWINNCLKDKPLEIFPYHWDLVGQPAPEVVLGKCSGQSSVNYWLKRLGIEVGDPSIVEQILNAVKEKSCEVKRLLNEEEFRQIVRSVTSQ